MATSMKQEWINYVYESDPADPVSFARMCARSAIKAGEVPCVLAGQKRELGTDGFLKSS
jgi:hypothetical protein